jgi:hypothetical protein
MMVMSSMSSVTGSGSACSSSLIIVFVVRHNGRARQSRRRLNLSHHDDFTRSPVMSVRLLLLLILFYPIGNVLLFLSLTIPVPELTGIGNIGRWRYEVEFIIVVGIGIPSWWKL